MATTKRSATKSPARKRPARKAPSRSASSAGTRVPTISSKDASSVTDLLQDRLVALLDLHLTLKHIHWNVTGPTFIAVHEMLDPQVMAVRDMSDAVAERIATMGGTPLGTPKAIVDGRRWDDYDLGRDTTDAHLRKLDAVYKGVAEDHRKAIDDLEDLDPVSEDLLTGQLGQLELFGWFIRSHLGD